MLALEAASAFSETALKLRPGGSIMPFCEPADRDIDAPGVVLVFQRREAGDGIDHQQRRMLGAVERLANFERMGDAAGRGLVVHHHTALILCCAIGGELRLDLLDVGAAPPVGRQEIDVELEFLGDAAPQHRELAGLGHQHLVAGRQRIDDRGFPGAGARRRIDDDRLLGAENALAARQHGMTEFGEFGDRDDPGSACPWPAAPGRARWSGLESEENAFQCAGSSGVLPGIFGFAAVEYHYLAGLSPARRAPSMHKKAGF